MKSRTSWREKFQRPAEPRVVEIPPKWAKTLGKGKMLIATPRLIAALVRNVPRGKLTTTTAIMARLARDHQCAATCPLTTGIFLRIVAEVAEEDAQAGKTDVIPYWRVLKADGSLNEKYPGGLQRQALRLEAEGHRIDYSRKAPRVANFTAQQAQL